MPFLRVRFMKDGNIGIEDIAFRDNDFVNKAVPREMRHTFNKAFAVIVKGR